MTFFVGASMPVDESSENAVTECSSCIDGSVKSSSLYDNLDSIWKGPTSESTFFHGKFSSERLTA